ncbi:MAG: hypothetical protein FWC34_04190 [Bacteroidetes bacterium]|nr:hypothetical protein [Bacteroidota bacterium]MCL2303416.1 hypothetical protein [Lentimicrobiaceae bacterium]
MINEAWYDYFMDILLEKYPKKAELVENLMDLLNIEREATYRRLRKEVMFPMYEIVKIAAAWNISIDEIIGVRSQKVCFQMQPMSYLEPSKEDVDFVRKRVQALELLRDSFDSEYMVACNNLSRSLSAGFEILYKFVVFKWSYEYCNSCNETFANIRIPEVLRKEVDKYHRNMKYVTNTSYILDNMLFENLIREIQFFHSILLITDEEKELIRKELHKLLDYLLEIANTGCFPETKNKVQIYVSMLNINTNYSYLYTGKTEMFRIHAFNMYDLINNNPEMIKNCKEWMQKKKRTSIQVSEVDEKTRIEFFTRLRQVVDSLQQCN